MMNNKSKIRKQMAYICHEMAKKGFICATEGNISVQLKDGTILITPSGIEKGKIRLEDFILIDQEGHKISGNGDPSSEALLHTQVYKFREDIQAVIHAHPTTVIALTIAGISLMEPILPEIVLTMGSIQTIPYATPGTGEIALGLGNFLGDQNAFLLDHHGSLTLGKNLQESFWNLERLEHVAKVLFMAHQLGKVKTLPLEEVKKILKLRKSFEI